MDNLDRISRLISQSVAPTFAAYIPLQLARKQEILTPPPTSHQYGPDPRQELDVFLPEGEGKKPVLVALYGGGFVGGAKQLEGTDGTLHGNVGRYFADRGFVTVLPDYRLYTAENGIRYPSGAEDLSLALQWLATPGNVPQADLSKVYLLGNSAGGVHVGTFLYAEPTTFKPASAIPGLTIRGATLLGAPLHYLKGEDLPKSVLEAYFGGADALRNTSVYELRKRSDDQTPVLVAWSELDPEEEILAPTRDFLALWKDSSKPLPGNPPSPSELELKGHNHISTIPALGLGGKEDKWGEDVVAWMKERL